MCPLDFRFFIGHFIICFQDFFVSFFSSHLANHIFFASLNDYAYLIQEHLMDRTRLI